MNGVKKYGSYIAVLFAGLFLGYLFFGESKTNVYVVWIWLWHKTTP